MKTCKQYKRGKKAERANDRGEMGAGGSERGSEGEGGAEGRSDDGTEGRRGGATERINGQVRDSDRKTESQPARRTCEANKQTDRKAEGQQTDRQAGMSTGRKARQARQARQDRQTSSQICRPDRQTARQSDVSPLPPRRRAYLRRRP
jgi:hypothetical protein